MNALIVDDEPHVIAVAKLLVDWKTHQIDTVYSCDSAEEALRLIEEKRPEIVLSDIRMPGLSGLELIERIKKIDPAIRTILITAYSDFSYAQKALQLGCVDYLLKPLTEEALNDAVAKAVSQYALQHTLIAESSRGRAQNLLSLFLASGHPLSAFAELCKIAPFFIGLNLCRVGVICTRHLPAESIDPYSVSGCVHDFLFSAGTGVSAVWGSPAEIVLLLREGSQDNVLLCRRLLEHLQGNFNVLFHVGLSQAEAFPQKLDTAFLAARENALSYNLLSKYEFVHLEAPLVPSLKIHPQLETILHSAVLNGQKERLLHAAMDCALGIAQNNFLTIRNLENFRSTYNAMRNKWIQGFLQEQNRPGVAISPFRAPLCLADGQFSAEQFAQTLYDDLAEISQQYVQPAEMFSSGDVLQKIHHYIAEHSEDALSLDTLATQFAISSGYLSRAFKKEFHIGLVDYLTQVRIGKAKNLIQNSPLKLSEIADAVGFSDPKYFSRVFKRITGCTPAEYRTRQTAEDDK